MKSDIIRKVFFLFFIIFLMCILSYKILEPIQSAHFKLYIKPRNPNHVNDKEKTVWKKDKANTCGKYSGRKNKRPYVYPPCECRPTWLGDGEKGTNISKGRARCDKQTNPFGAKIERDWYIKTTSFDTEEPYKSNHNTVLNSIIFKNDDNEVVHAWHLNRHNLFSNADEKTLDVHVPFNAINNKKRNIRRVEFKVLNDDAHYERILIHPEGRQDNYNGYYGNTMQNRDNNVILYNGSISNGSTVGDNLRNNHKIQTYEYVQSSVGASDNITSQT